MLVVTEEVLGLESLEVFLEEKIDEQELQKEKSAFDKTHQSYVGNLHRGQVKRKKKAELGNTRSRW